MFKIIRLFLLCLVCVSLPFEINAQTQVRQKTEPITTKHAFRVAKKKVVGVKIHHPQKKAVKKNHTKTTTPLHEKEKLVKAIIYKHQFALTVESLKTGVPLSVFVGIISQESEGDPNAIGTDGKGSLGLSQTRAIANKESGIYCNSFEPVCSIKQLGGYLMSLKILRKIDELPRRILGFNWGPSRAKNHKGDPKNTDYVRGVAGYMRIAAKELQEKPPF